MKYLLDSNIIIYHLNGESLVSEFLISNGMCSAISQITYIEVLSFEFTKQEELSVKELLESFKIIDVNKDIAMQAIENRKLKKIKIADNIIASTAQINHLTLVTRNISDFNSLPMKILNIFDGIK